MTRNSSSSDWSRFSVNPRGYAGDPKDSEILDAGEREHEEMSDITAIWLLKRHKMTHV